MYKGICWANCQAFEVPWRQWVVIAGALVADAAPGLLVLRVVHHVAVVHRRLLLRDLPRLAFSLGLVVLRLRTTVRRSACHDYHSARRRVSCPVCLYAMQRPEQLCCRHAKDQALSQCARCTLQRRLLPRTALLPASGTCTAVGLCQCICVEPHLNVDALHNHLPRLAHHLQATCDVSAILAASSSCMSVSACTSKRFGPKGKQDLRGQRSPVAGYDGILRCTPWLP